MKILITNAYSARNKGDAGIILGMIRDLTARENFRDAQIAVSSADFPGDRDRYPCRVVPSLNSVCRSYGGYAFLRQLLFLAVVRPLTMLWAFVYRVFGKRLGVPAPLREMLDAYADADLIIAAGGGYLYTRSLFRGNVVLLMALHSFLLGRMLGRPVVLYSQSIGPFASIIQEWIVVRALRRTQMIILREDASSDLLRDWRLPVPLHRGVDAAFLVEPEPLETDLLPENEDRMLVGMTVRSWFRRPSAQKQYEKTLASFVDWLVAEHKADVVFVPQVTHTQARDDDRVVARRIAGRTSNALAVRVIEQELSAGQIKTLCGRMRFFVGTRMHSNIFALSMGVPTMAIGYQPKTEEIMGELDASEYVVSVEALSFDALRSLFLRLMEHEQETRDRLRELVPVLCEGAMLTGQLVEEAYRRWQPPLRERRRRLRRAAGRVSDRQQPPSSSS